MLDAVLALNGLDTRVFDASGVAATPHEAADYITVPDAHLLFNGEFKRVGTNDLKIEGSDGKSFFIEDYFSSDNHKHLMSPEGALLTSNIVDALAGPLAPGQHAQAGAQPAAAQAVIGRVETASGSCTVVRNGVTVVLNAGDNVRKGDVVVTSSSSAVAIVFTDGSTFSLSANARMVLDEFVYTEGGSNNTASISLVQGTFNFLAGQVAKTGNMKVDTPVATMGIRGTAVKAEVSAFDGTTRFIVMDERDPATNNVTTGSFELLDKRTGQVLATVNASSVSWVVAPSGPQQVTVTPSARSPAEIQQDFATVQQMLTIYNNFQTNPIQPSPDQPDKRGQIDQGTTGNSASAGGSGGVLTNAVNQQTNFTVTVAPGTIGNPILIGNVVPIGTGTTPGAGTGTSGGSTGSGAGTGGGVTQPPQTVTIITGSGIIIGTAGADIIYGSDANDTITALQGNDQVFAGGGNDIIIAAHGEGRDFYDGGLGFDTIRFDSTTNGVTFNLNVSSGTLGDGTVVKVSTADGVDTGHDDFVRFEKIVGSPGNDVFILHDLGDWEIDGGAGVDIVRIDGALDLTAANGGPFAYNIEILDLNQNFANRLELNPADVWQAAGQTSPNGQAVLRILGGTTDVIEMSNTYQVAGESGSHIGTWQLVRTFVDPSADNVQGDPFNDHSSDGVTFEQYQFVSDGQVLATVYIQDGITIDQAVTQTNAVNDTAAMTENQTISVDVLANDAPGFVTTRSLTSIGSASISGPEGVTLDGVQIQIVNNQLSIAPGTALDALAEGQTATITVPYTMQISGTGQTLNAVATITVTGTNDAPTTSVVTLASVAEDGTRLITTAQLLANAADVDGDALSVSNVQIASGGGTLVNNNDGTWTYTPAANDNSAVSFNYTITDGAQSNPLSVAGSATLDITPVNDAPTTSAVALAAIAEDSGARIITSAELLANAADVDGDALTVSNVQIASGNGSLVNNNNGTWTYTPAANDDTSVSFSYSITDTGTTGGSADPKSVAGSATLEITPVNDAPTTSAVTLAAIAEDSGARIITSAELLANAADVEGDGFTVSNLHITDGNGSLVDNNNGTWTYTPAANDDTAVSFGYTITDNGTTNGAADHQSVVGSATLDITPVEEPVSAQDDYAGMTENQTLFVNVTANDAAGADTSKTLSSLGAAEITGPDGVTLGTPAIVIENNQIRVTPGTAFDALAEGETATIEVPYTVHLGTGEYLTATAIITVTGTNDAPHFSTLPEGYQTIGVVDPQTSFGGVEAVQITTEGASQAQIEDFLQLDHGALSAVNAETTDGGAIAFDLDLAAGETVTFSWNFASTEYEPYNDYAFFSASGGEGSDTIVKLSDIYAIGDNVNDNYLHSSGWQQFTYTAGSGGDYRFGIGTMNTIDTVFDSSLYISGFSGLGFRRTTTESGNVETFDLLNGASDPDTHDVLTATNIVVLATDSEGNVVDITGAYTVVGHELSIDPHYFDYLTDGQSVTIVATYDVSDGHVAMHNSATLVVNGEGEEANNRPILSAEASPALSSVNQDAGAPVNGTAVGTLVSELVDLSSTESGLNNVTDADAGAVTGMAIFINHAAHGDLYFSTDDGETWSLVGEVSDSAALLLAADGETRLYFQPAEGFNGTIEDVFTFRAWDQTEGANGERFDIHAGGTNTDSVSSAPDHVGITVEAPPENQAPVANAAEGSGEEDQSTPISVVLTGNDSDGSVTGFKLLSLPTDGWLYADISSSTPIDSGDLANILSASGGSTTLYFKPAENWNGETHFQYVAIDNDNAESADPGTATITVSAVNDAPGAADIGVSTSADNFSIPVTLSGSDSDGTIASFQLSSLPADGTLYEDAEHQSPVSTGQNYLADAEGHVTFYFVPNPEWPLQTTFEFVAYDDLGAPSQAPGHVTITADPGNATPIVENVEACGTEDAASIAITLTGSDSDGAISGFKLLTLPDHGQLFLDEDMTTALTAQDLETLLSSEGSSLTLYFKPAADFHGTAEFQFVAVDDQNTQSETSATASINVESAPEGEVFVYAGVEGFDTLQLPERLAESDIVAFNENQFELHYVGQGESDYYYFVGGYGLTYTQEGDEIRLTGGTITHMMAGPDENYPTTYLTGFNISATGIQGAVDAAHEGDPTALEAIFRDYQYTTVGSTGPDTFVGGDFADHLAGGSGINVLTGNTGPDTFIYQGGEDIVTDFVSGDDKIDLSNYQFNQSVFIHSMADLGPYAQQVGNDTVISFGEGETLRLVGVTLNNLTDNDFVFYTPDHLVERGASDTANDEAYTAYQVLSPNGQPATFDSSGWIAVPQDAAEYNGHYYQYVTGAISWTDARAAALGMGGHLVTIGDSYENDFVHGLTGSNGAWIGATDAGAEGHWVWADGAEGGQFNNYYTAWWGDEPNGGSSENYAFIDHNGAWTDVPNNYEPVTGYVVEFDRQGYAQVGTYGTAVFDPESGSLVYTLNNGDADTQALAAGQTVTDSFTLTFIDSNNNPITRTTTFTVEGTNDAPIFFLAEGDAASASLDETNAGLSASGTLHVSDVDAGSELTVSVSDYVYSYGKTGVSPEELLSFLDVSLAPDGKVTWTFDSGDTAFNGIGPDETATLYYTVQVSDGTVTTDQAIEITIHGSNDAPVAQSDTLTGNAADSITLTLSAVDDSNSVTFALADAATLLTLGQFSDNGFSSYLDATGLEHLTSSNSYDGVLSKTLYFRPYDAGTFNFEFTATDHEGLPSAQPGTISIDVGPRVVQQNVSYGEPFDADSFYSKLGGATLDPERSSQYELWLINPDDHTAFRLGGNFTFDAENPEAVTGGNVTYLAVYGYDAENDQVTSEQSAFYNFKFEATQLLDAIDTYHANPSEGQPALDTIFNNVVYHIYGNDGADVLRGGDYADEINGNHGNDTLTGGGGDDVFLFSSDWVYTEGNYVAVGPGHDTITDFTQGHDKISVYQLYDTQMQNLRFNGFDDLDGRIAVEGGDTTINLGDGDVVTLHNFTGTLTANDFIFHPNNSNLLA